jgi:hypothetical protein
MFETSNFLINNNCNMTAVLLLITHIFFRILKGVWSNGTYFIRIALGWKKILIELHSGKKQILVELHSGSKKVFQ